MALCPILCCKCGVEIYSNDENMCLACLSADEDFTTVLERHYTLTFCPKCERYLTPPSQWIAADLESPELLALCIKRVNITKKDVDIRNARFIWTEPHSKKLSIELTVRKELQSGELLEQLVQVDFGIHSQQCPICARVAAKDYWNACVQVRQKVEHKKTLLRLEQIILRAGMHKHCTNIKQLTGGIDFFFDTRAQAISFVAFITKYAPCRYQTAQHLKSHDCHNNVYNYKYTFSVEIAPICKNDVVCLSRVHSQRFGGIGQLCVVTKVGESIHLIDPLTCQTYHVDGKTYFASPFTSVATQKQLSSFTVVDIEYDERKNCPHKSIGSVKRSKVESHFHKSRISKEYSKVSAWVTRGEFNVTQSQSSIVEQTNSTVHTHSHLGRIIHVGDTVMGLDLRNYNVNNVELDKLSENQCPDVILVLRPKQHLACDVTKPEKICKLSVEMAPESVMDDISSCESDDDHNLSSSIEMDD